MIDHGMGVPAGASVRGPEEAGILAWIPAGVFSQMAFMITKESHSIAMKSLRQEQILRGHGDAVEVVSWLNPKFPDLIPRPLGLANARPWTFRLCNGQRSSRDGCRQQLARTSRLPEVARYQMFRYERARTKPVEDSQMVSPESCRDIQ
jgi:hypothetical protein